jgi:hypothetical protein
MNIRTIALILIASCIASTINAGKIFIKNDYNVPVIVILDGNPIRELRTGEEDELAWIPKSIKIQIKFTDKFDTNKIQQELNKIINATKTNPNFVAKITIFNLGDYVTNIQNQPTRPIPTPELMLFNGTMTTEQYVMGILQGKNPAYNQTDVNNVRQLKGHAEELLQNINRLQIKGYNATTADAKKSYIEAGEHPYYALVLGIDDMQSFINRNSQKFISDIKANISMKAKQLANQKANNKWMLQ